jgi:hypothetical protein
VLQWARSNGCPWNEETCARAAEYGHFELLSWAKANGAPEEAEEEEEEEEEEEDN